MKHIPKIFYKLSDIWHFTICKIWRENCCDTPPIRSWNFPSPRCKQLICMRYAQICQNFSHLALWKWPLAVGLDIYYKVHGIPIYCWENRKSFPVCSSGAFTGFEPGTWMYIPHNFLPEWNPHAIGVMFPSSYLMLWWNPADQRRICSLP